MEVHVKSVDLIHLAFSILHGTFSIETKPIGGCSCEVCQQIKRHMDDLARDEATKFYNEHYPPPGGFL